MKRTIAFFTVLVMLLALLPAGVLAAEEDGAYKCEYVDGGVAITGYTGEGGDAF